MTVFPRGLRVYGLSNAASPILLRRTCFLILALSELQLALSLLLPRSKASTSRNHYSLQLSNFQNVQYSAPFSVGGQVLPVIYDTGSFEILVLSARCARCIGGTATVYDHAQSSTFVASSIQTEHHFGSGPVLSQKGYESVRLGDGSSPYAVSNMPFWQVLDHDIDVWGPDAKFSGIVGMAHVTTVPQGYGAQGSTDSTLLHALGVSTFAFCLQRGKPPTPGWMVIGPSYNPSLFRTIEVVGQVHWGVRMTEFGAPGVAVANPCNPSCGAIVDSGTSLIAIPPAAAEMAAALEDMIAEDCSNIHSLPVLRLNLDGVIVDLPPQAYVMQVNGVTMKNTTIWDAVFKGPKFKSTKSCTTAFMEIDKQSQFGPVFILGMPFMRYYYTIFDRGNRMVHISQANSACEAVGPYGDFGLANLSNASYTSTKSFSDADFTPLQVDLNSARAPEWAFGKTADNHMIM